MKIRVGVVGYGNLGKEVVKKIQKDDKYHLVGVFTKRNLPDTFRIYDMPYFRNTIDLMFVCSGSQNELEGVTRQVIKDFDLIECYDDHNRLRCHIKEMDYVAKRHKKIALCSFGWDPGLFSLMRGLFDSLGYTPYSFWGKGLSQGHTQALKAIDGVKDAVQFTIPNKEMIAKIKNGEKPVQSPNFHRRECFVVCDKDRQREIKQKIVSMPDYFENYKTNVHFIDQERLDKIKSFAHKGQVLTAENVMNFSLNLPSNPEFTAGVMTTFGHCYEKLKQNEKFGAYSIFDVPMNYILKDEPYKYL